MESELNEERVMRLRYVVGLCGLMVVLSLAWPFMFGVGLGTALVSLADGQDSESVEYDYVRGDEGSENKILRIEVKGPILDEPVGFASPFEEVLSGGVVYGYVVKELLMEAVEDESIQAVMVEVNSPGGTITGSRAIKDGLDYFKERTGKPVYGFGSGLVASGGYWVMLGVDEVIVDSGSLVGSIGVVSGQFPVFEGVTELDQGLLGLGVSAERIEVKTITAGEGKDFGNPFRQPTEKELAIMQESADLAYEGFVSAVSEKRGLLESVVTDEIGAYVYGEVKARDLGLVDVVGNREEAYERLAETAELEEYQVVDPGLEVGFWASLLSSRLDGVGGQESESSQKANFCVFRQKSLVYFGAVEDLCGL